MNKYQLNVLWTSSIILTLLVYLLCFLVLEKEELTSLIITLIFTVIIIGFLLIISLKHKDEEKLKQNWRLIRKYLIVFSSLVISVALYYLINTIIENVVQANYAKKEKLLQEHMDNPFWESNNLDISNETLWHREDYSHKEYRRLNELNFLLRNNSPVDIWSLELELTVYTENGNYENTKNISIWTNISAHSTKNIKHIFGINDFEMIPNDFYWIITKIRAKADNFYVRNKTFEEINNYIISDSLSLKSSLNIGWESKDWDALEKELEDSNKID